MPGTRVRGKVVGAVPNTQTGTTMTTIDRAAATRHVYFHDPLAPVATVVAPSVFVAVRWHHGALLLVRRRDTGAWELPGGRVDVGETAVHAAVRETAEEAGVRIEVTEFAGLFSDPGVVVRSPDGEVRQQFALLFRARWLGGVPRGDQHETSDAAWVLVADIAALPMEPPIRSWVARAVAVGEPPVLR
jgi:8-oxo-dGTP diphosphatase